MWYSNNMIKQQGATILSARGAEQVRRPLTGSWRSAAGMMRRHKQSMERYITAVRKEWR